MNQISDASLQKDSEPAALLFMCIWNSLCHLMHELIFIYTILKKNARFLQDGGNLSFFLICANSRLWIQRYPSRLLFKVWSPSLPYYLLAVRRKNWRYAFANSMSTQVDVAESAWILTWLADSTYRDNNSKPRKWHWDTNIYAFMWCLSSWLSIISSPS